MTMRLAPFVLLLVCSCTPARGPAAGPPDAARPDGVAGEGLAASRPAAAAAASQPESAPANPCGALLGSYRGALGAAKQCRRDADCECESVAIHGCGEMINRQHRPRLQALAQQLRAANCSERSYFACRRSICGAPRCRAERSLAGQRQGKVCINDRN